MFGCHRLDERFADVVFVDAATKRNGTTFLSQAIDAFPDRILTELPRYRGGATKRFGGYICDRVCYECNV